MRHRPDRHSIGVPRATAVALSLLAVVPLAGCGTQATSRVSASSSPTGGHTSSPPPSAEEGSFSDPVKWLAEHVAATQVEEPEAPTCSASQISVKASGSGLFSGGGRGPADFLTLENTGENVCTLPGPPTVVVAATDGTVQQAEPGAFQGHAVTLSPGELADFVIGAPVWPCPSPSDGQVFGNYLTIHLAPGDSGVRLPSEGIDMQCTDPQVLDFEDRRDAPSTDPRAALTADLAPSSQAVAGKVFEYTVTLSNPTYSDIKLEPCPSYTEALNGQEQTLLLNCQYAPVIPAKGSVSFAMQIPVPADTPPGLAKLGWWLNFYGGASTGLNLDVGE